MHAAHSTRSDTNGLAVRDRESVRTSAAFFAYVAVALVFTWPLAKGLARDVPSDLGDSLLNMWILGWNCERLIRLLTGDWSVVFGWFGGNIFYPTPDALAYSEHLIAQAIQVLPFYVLTRNPILCYNLLFLSTYVLSGLGTYLLVRELTHDRRAAFIAGLLFGFIPYRIPQASHMQVLSSQWMPFALFGLTRYLNTGSRRALTGGATALAVQSLSCGYYLIYFSPFALGYVVWELARRGRAGEWKTWRNLTAAAVACGMAVVPFLIPYARVRETLQLTRRIEEVSLYSADVYAYLTAFPIQRFWGPLLQTFPRGEGELFLGAIPMLLGIASVGLQLYEGFRASASRDEPRPIVSAALGLITMTALALSIVAVFSGRLSIEFAGVALRVLDIQRPLLWFGAGAAAWFICSPRLRQAARALFTTEVFFSFAIIVAWWLSLGPTPTALGQSLDMPAPYRLLYMLPGVDGVRVPARLAMVVALMLSVLAGFVMARLPRRRTGGVLATAVVLVFLAEAPASEFPLNGVSRTPGFGAAEARVYPPAAAPAIYQTVRSLAGHVVLLELPIGDPNWDVRAVFYSTSHWLPLVNGYSGFIPPHYGSLIARLNAIERDPGAAQQALADSGATHVLVHDAGFSVSDAAAMRRWLEGRGARTIARHENDILYDIRAR